MLIRSNAWFLVAIMVAVNLWAQPKSAPQYEVYAIRYATIHDFPVASLVQGADRSRKLDIAMTNTSTTRARHGRKPTPMAA